MPAALSTRRAASAGRGEEVGQLAVGGGFGAASFGGGVVVVGEFGLDGGQWVEEVGGILAVFAAAAQSSAPVGWGAGVVEAVAQVGDLGAQFTQPGLDGSRLVPGGCGRPPGRESGPRPGWS